MMCTRTYLIVVVVVFVSFTCRNMRVLDNDVVLSQMSHKIEPLDRDTRTQASAAT